MYTIERTMKFLKGYVKNVNRPEAFIVQKYVSKEAMEFCQNYFAKDILGFQNVTMLTGVGKGLQ